MVKSQNRLAWAIHTQSAGGHGFIGYGYLPEWKWELPAQLSGNRTALFRTRQQAREALRRIKRPDYGYKNARVYRVSVTVEGVPA